MRLGAAIVVRVHLLIRSSLVGLCSVLVSRPLSAQQIEGAAIRRQLQGQVRDSASKLPVPGVTVTIGETKLATVTDTAGRYRLIGLLPASVTLTFHRLGFIAATRRGDLSRGTATINVSLIETTQTLEAMTVRVDSAAAPSITNK